MTEIRLIDADALKISFKEHCCGECDCCVHQKEGFSCELIDNAPTVELRLMKCEECAGHTIDYAMGWKACIEWIKKGGAE